MDLDRKGEDILGLLEIILSCNNRRAKQEEIAKFLATRPDILLPLLKTQLMPGSQKETLNITSSHEGKDPAHEALTGVDINDTSLSTVQEKAANERNTSICHNSYQVNSTSRESDQREGKDLQKQETEHLLPKKRKSKYSYIQGDLSHIRREPKRSKYSIDVENRSEEETKTRSSQTETRPSTTVDGTALIEHVDNEEQERILARRMIEILLRPPSVSCQQRVLDALRKNDKLRSLFNREKLKMGKILVPVFRQRSGDFSEQESGNKENSLNALTPLLNFLNDDADFTNLQSQTDPFADFNVTNASVSRENNGEQMLYSDYQNVSDIYHQSTVPSQSNVFEFSQFI